MRWMWTFPEKLQQRWMGRAPSSDFGANQPYPTWACKRNAVGLVSGD
jgi:hypothetical protein